jgi:hypothetical protein
MRPPLVATMLAVRKHHSAHVQLQDQQHDVTQKGHNDTTTAFHSIHR